jgi:hypothetical protein
MYGFLFSAAYVAGDAERPASRIHLRPGMHLVFAGKLDDDRPFLSLIEHERVARLKRQQ